KRNTASGEFLKESPAARISELGEAAPRALSRAMDMVTDNVPLVKMPTKLAGGNSNQTRPSACSPAKSVRTF
ncbi:MAG TPA: hypothetical protein VMJ32_03985, partial [Pirellulales bacterium]|nr:hypothetical protein [Pirellulales bacterium]